MTPSPVHHSRLISRSWSRAVVLEHVLGALFWLIILTCLYSGAKDLSRRTWMQGNAAGKAAVHWIAGAR